MTDYVTADVRRVATLRVKDNIDTLYHAKKGRK